jgi:phage tail sheath protein FI
MVVCLRAAACVFSGLRHFTPVPVMPPTLTYPGVYIEEIPSGVRTITGVATSITAFLGRAVRGPVDEPVTINNFGDFERAFGGLGYDYPMSYAVRDFFQNGGAQAVIVRLYADPDDLANSGYAELNANELTLDAASRGSWANGLRARIDHDIPDDLPWLASFGLTDADLFNLSVRDTVTGATETFVNVTVADSPRRVDRVLEEESTLVRTAGSLPASIPSAHPGPDSGTDVWVDGPSNSTVSTDGTDSAPLASSSDFTGSRSEKTGMYALEDTDLFNLLCIPADQRGGTTPTAVYDEALTYCEEQRAVLIVDPPADWSTAAEARDGLSGLGLTGQRARNAAIYFPRVVQADPLLDGQPDTFVPCGVVAGVIARTDATRGVWKAPAGIDASLRNTQALDVKMTDDENGMLNPLGINSLRSFPVTGRVVWGARTMRGADQLADEYKYLPVRRLALFLEETLYRGTQWVVFEPNDEPLWAQIRLNIGAFMQNLFRQGAFQGSSSRDAYFVKVDSETTTQTDINLGIVNVVVGFAPLKPAEFVVIKIQQMAGQIDT